LLPRFPLATRFLSGDFEAVKRVTRGVEGKAHLGHVLLARGMFRDVANEVMAVWSTCYWKPSQGRGGIASPQPEVGGRWMRIPKD
jgi:hypothetical protein